MNNKKIMVIVKIKYRIRRCVNLKPDILPLHELEKLEEAEKIETLRQYRAAYTIKDLSQAWNLNNPIQYYMWLKKQHIYEQIVRKADKFEPSKEWKRMQASGRLDSGRKDVRSLSADQFRYTLDTESVGQDLAHVFNRLADFLLNEKGQFRCRIELKGIAHQPTGDASLEA
ncbi:MULTISPECIES: hypothetical protein [Cohnella]|uniref:Uncharacterized protein n=1 Tax=Cohnella phaseoli TaxID=456490 RepID=A0A3D9JPI9_9BACL|nr:hypothetical protein [Cohnella phaseoli]RED75467.1 hypothetical protein DFP98_11582 [Cohnella phaseoli]